MGIERVEWDEIYGKVLISFPRPIATPPEDRRGGQEGTRGEVFRRMPEY